MNLKAGGLGNLGAEQLAWLADDLKAISIDADRRLCPHPALGGLSRMGLGHGRCSTGPRILKRFGSVTVLNGHIHQIMQKVEGNVTFHTARSTPSRSRRPELRPRLAP